MKKHEISTAKDMILAWIPETDQVRLVPWPDYNRSLEPREYTSLACESKVRRMNFEERQTVVFQEKKKLIERDQCDPQAVHRALLGLQEYRDGCPDDMPGLVR